MTLRESALKVQFRGGIDTKSDSLTVPPVRLLALENGVFTRATSIKKRNGYESLSQIIDGSASLADDAIRTAARGDELVAFAPTRSYSRQSGVDQWSDVGAVYSAIGRDRPLVKTGTQQTQPDAATLDGVTVVAWEDSAGGVWWSAVDTVSERVLLTPTQADPAGSRPRVLAVGGNLHIYYAVAVQHRVMLIVVNPAAPSAAVTPVILIDDINGTNVAYDACPTTRSGTPSAIAWQENGTTNIRVGYVDLSGVLGGPATGHPTVHTLAADFDPTSPLALAYSEVDGGTGDWLTVAFVDATTDSTIHFLHGGSSSVPIATFNTFGGATSTDVVRITAVMLNDQAWVCWEEDAAESSERHTRIELLDAVTGGVSVSRIRSVGLASRAFAIGIDAFAAFIHDTTFFNTYLTIRLSDAFVVGRHQPGFAASVVRNILPSAHVEDDVVTFALPVRERLVSEGRDQFRETGLRLFSLDFDDEDSHQTAQLGRGLYLAGACPQHYDGRVWSEQGFHFGPELIVATPSNGGASLTSDTTYEYRAWYESTDAQGEIHRGPTSIGTLVTLGALDDMVTLELPTLRVTGKTNVRICVARSLAADTGDTAQFFRVTSLDPAATGANGYVANDKTVDSVLFVDSMSDATLREQEELYTDGGILSNDPVALGSVIARGKRRLFATDPSDGNILRYSQPLDDGFGVEWPPDLTQPIDPFGGDVTALAVQDDRIVVFKASAIFVFAGDGPLPNGDTATSGFSAPQLVTSDVGCTAPSSIVLTPAGLMFRSAKGIYLFDRSGSVSYVGAPVEGYNSQTVRRATVMPDRTQVVFLTNSGLTLLYDYLFGQWSTFTNHEGLDAVVVANQYHYLRTDGRMYRETLGVYSDAGTRIRLRLETAWLHMIEHLQGFQRFWFAHFLGTWQSAHQFGIQYQTDYAPQWTELYWMDATGLSSSTGWLTGSPANTIGVEPITGSAYGVGQYSTGIYGGTPSGIYQWRVHLNEKGQSIRFAVEDFEAIGYTGASFELTELLITGGVKAAATRPFTAGRSA